MIMRMPHEVATHDTIAANVRAEVARAQVTQTDLGEALGLTQTQVSRRLAGHVEFGATELAVLADYLGVAVSTFYAGTRADEPVAP